MNSYLNSGVILVYKVILNELDGQCTFPNATSTDNYQLVFCHSGWKREKVNGKGVTNRKETTTTKKYSDWIYSGATWEKPNL